VWNDIITAISLIRAIGALVHPVALQLVTDAATVRAAELSFSATCSIHHTHAYLKMHCPLTRASHIPPPSSGSLVILQQAVSGLRKRAPRHSGSPVQDVSARFRKRKPDSVLRTRDVCTRDSAIRSYEPRIRFRIHPDGRNGCSQLYLTRCLEVCRLLRC